MTPKEEEEEKLAKKLKKEKKKAKKRRRESEGDDGKKSRKKGSSSSKRKDKDKASSASTDDDDVVDAPPPRKEELEVVPTIGHDDSDDDDDDDDDVDQYAQPRAVLSQRETEVIDDDDDDDDDDDSRTNARHRETKPKSPNRATPAATLGLDDDDDSSTEAATTNGHARTSDRGARRAAADDDDGDDDDSSADDLDDDVVVQTDKDVRVTVRLEVDDDDDDDDASSSRSDHDRRPLVVSFLNGAPSASSTTTGGTIAPPRFSWHEVADERLGGGDAGRRRLVVEGRDAACAYESVPRPSKTFPRTELLVGVFDRRTSTLRLRSAAGRHLLPLRQTVRSRADGATTTTTTTNDDNPETSLAALTEQEKRRVLFDEFGSVKKKRALRASDNNQVNADAVVGNLMGAVSKEKMSASNVAALEETRRTLKESQDKKIETDLAVTKALEAARRAFLPPFDADAQLPSEVYDPRVMCGDDCWSQICRTVDACVKANRKHRDDDDEEDAAAGPDHDLGWISALLDRHGPWPAFVADLLRAVENPLADVGVFKIRCAVLLHYLVKVHKYFRDGPSGGKNSNSKRNNSGGRRNVTLKAFASQLGKRLGVPQEAALWTTGRFTVREDLGPAGGDGPNRYSVDKQTTDRLLVHALLLFVMADGGREMRVGCALPVVRHLQIEASTAGNLLRQAGCAVATKRGASGGNNLAVVLRVPLTFPPPKRKRSRGA